MTNAINTNHVNLCIALGGALGAAHTATGSLQTAINAVRQAKIKFGKSARTCPYKLALRDAIVTGKTLTVSARDVLLSIVMKAVHSKNGVYIAAPSKAKGKGKGKNKKQETVETGEDDTAPSAEATPARPFQDILTELRAHTEYANFCAMADKNKDGLAAVVLAVLAPPIKSNPHNKRVITLT